MKQPGQHYCAQAYYLTQLVFKRWLSRFLLARGENFQPTWEPFIHSFRLFL